MRLFYQLGFLFLLPTAAYSDAKESAATISKITASGLAGATPVDPAAGLLKVMIGLIIVVGAIFISAWLYQRYGRVNKVNGEGLKVVGGLSIGNKERVVLLQVGDKQLLVGVTPSHIETLHVLDQPLQAGNADVRPFNQRQLKNRLADAIRQRATL
ncbi:MAG: flagellar biosynthetic protein FliO [Gammaproteobacteria bacterium]|nr:flagellar biosynthetic protein FliO [Gammaproteobacteria bacterium]MDH5693331.1 flagellar biosynthetic protein FliO [Gammaproteobacteria bacterium]